MNGVSPERLAIVLSALTTDWVYFDEFSPSVPEYRPTLVSGALRSLRSRHLVEYLEPDPDVHPCGQWRLTEEGDLMLTPVQTGGQDIHWLISVLSLNLVPA